MYEQTLRSPLGPDLLERLTVLPTELLDHPHRNPTLSYLMEKSNTLIND